MYLTIEGLLKLSSNSWYFTVDADVTFLRLKTQVPVVISTLLALVLLT
jgi:hypothetical protein